jgi:hypothetical protein
MKKTSLLLLKVTLNTVTIPGVRRHGNLFLADVRKLFLSG